MNFILTRQRFAADFTLGTWEAEDGSFMMLTLEDTDRGLLQGMPLDELVAKKIQGKTAIPLGKYRLDITFSPHFQKNMIQIIDVDGFSGIRVHSGVSSADTDGCVLGGTQSGAKAGEIHGGLIIIPQLKALIASEIAAGQSSFVSIIKSELPRREMDV